MVRSPKLVLMALAMPAILLAVTKVYDVTPFRNCIGETDSVPPNNKVSQSFINVVDDSLTVISLWVGDRGNGEAFSVVIKDEDEVTVAHRSDFPAPGQSWTWLNIPLIYDAPPVRGKTYKATFTRPTGAAISYAYNPNDEYEHGV